MPRRASRTAPRRPVVAIVAAAGSGTRVGGSVPKQFLKAGGRTLLDHAISRLARHPDVDAVVAVVPASRVRSASRLMARHRRLVAVVAGGRRRQDSVERGLAAIPAGRGVLVLVHDAARPLVSPKVVSAIVRAALRDGAAIPGLAPADTVKEVSVAGRVERTLDRSSLRLIQTPQGFRAEWLRRAYAVARRRRLDASDDASLVEAAGMPVTVVDGDPQTFKVTTRADVVRLRAFMRGPK
ncbi:MAG: 2-C-methyl-D-erythritol 4-phosphate cytidylyltransferase [Acidobacteria bacterium]|nr:2-C-methyl-D-erythritol 4-phosphate cytidylyltransferase [Acidobacteriota bacterium]